MKRCSVPATIVTIDLRLLASLSIVAKATTYTLERRFTYSLDKDMARQGMKGSYSVSNYHGDRSSPVLEMADTAEQQSDMFLSMVQDIATELDLHQVNYSKDLYPIEPLFTNQFHATLSVMPQDFG